MEACTDVYVRFTGFNYSLDIVPVGFEYVTLSVIDTFIAEDPALIFKKFGGYCDSAKHFEAYMTTQLLDYYDEYLAEKTEWVS